MQSRAETAPLPPLLRWGGVGDGGLFLTPRAIDQRVPRTRSFRQNPTDAERKLWQALRSLNVGAVHFRRQATIGPYFADFACHTTRLVTEVDGGQHTDGAADLRRTAFPETHGYRGRRFWNHDVLGNLEGVMHVIADAVAAPPTPDPSPLQERGEGSDSPMRDSI